jgi:GDP-L-fucose synthase
MNFDEIQLRSTNGKRLYMQQSKILITGGSGLVGKQLKDILPEAVYVSSKDFDLTNINRVHSMMDFFKPKTVIHLAARVGGIVDNITYPVDFLEENILMNTNVLKKCHEFNVKRVIAILSTCAYPDKVKTYPMTEKDLFNGPPTPTNFSYGLTKRCMAAHIDSYVEQYDKKWCYLIPCNLYGDYDKFDDHNSHFVAALIKKIKNADNKIELMGTGSPLRQFMHAEDLAYIIKYMIENNIVDNFNIAPKGSYSIKEIAEIGLKACNKEHLELIFDETKPDGQYRKDVDSSKLFNVLVDFKFTTLEDGIKKVYDTFSKRYN